MDRREFIGLIGATALSVPLPGYAQTKRDIPLVGILHAMRSDDTGAKDRIEALRHGMQDEGFIEGTNYSLVVKSAEGDYSRMTPLGMELAALTPRVIVTIGYGISGGFAPIPKGSIREKFPTMPVVFTGVAADPIALGWAQSYNYPGGMTTGNVMNAVGGEESIAEKRVELFKQCVPGFKRLGMISPAGDGRSKAILAVKEKAALQKLAARLDFEFVPYDLDTIDDLDGAIEAGLRDDVSGFYISQETVMAVNMSRIVSLVNASGKPSIGPTPYWGRAGLLLSYATDPLDGLRHAGIYAAKILKGTKPGDLPIEQATKFVLVINLKTAKTLRIVVPPNVLALADEVIE